MNNGMMSAACRITITASGMQQWFYIALTTLAVLSLFSWKENILQGQWLIQLLLVAVILLYILFYLRPSVRAGEIVAELTADGHWQRLNGPENENKLTDSEANGQWQIQSGSRITPWLIWLSLTHKITGQHAMQLVFRDAVSESHYRTICRAVRRSQVQKVSAATSKHLCK